MKLDPRVRPFGFLDIPALRPEGTDALSPSSELLPSRERIAMNRASHKIAAITELMYVLI